MANFSKNNFLVPVGDSTNLRIRDIKGSMKYTVYNNHETMFINNDTTVVVRAEGDVADIILDFGSKIEAIQALSILNLEYSKIKKNSNDKKRIKLIEDIGISVSGEIKEIIFSNEPGAELLSNGQTVFNIPNIVSINLVIINGIVVNDYSLNNTTGDVILDINLIGYNIEDTDEVIIKYY